MFVRGHAFAALLLCGVVALVQGMRQHRHPLDLRLHQPLWSSSCPCANVSLCDPVTPRREKEVVAFQIRQQNWRSYNWSRITTLVLYDGIGDGEMLCHAHANGVSVVWATGFPVEQLLDNASRSWFISETAAHVASTFTDGINMDFEAPIVAGSPQVAALSSLMQEVADAVRNVVPRAQVSFDVPWNPNNTNGRNYDFASIAVACDFLVIMDYDTRSQVWTQPVDNCTAGPNAPRATMVEGIADYVNGVGVPPSQLVLGVPWYGYAYPCAHSIAEDAPTLQICHIPGVPYGGCNCTGTTGREFDFSVLASWLAGLNPNITVANGTFTEDVFGGWASFNFVAHGVNATHKVWFDTPAVLSAKFEYALQTKLRGVSMWNVDSIVVNATSPVAPWCRKMWRALDSFRSPGS